MRNKLKAFTLAETLITLGVIGIVAAITIPTIIQNYQKTQYVTALKKVYSQTNQLLLQMAVDNGTPDNIADYFPGTLETNMQKIIPYFKVAKNCGISTNMDCFARFNTYPDGKSSTTTPFNTYNSYYKFVTADGMSIAISSYPLCSTSTSFTAAADIAPNAKTCGYFYVDVNGTKPPNWWGKDVFSFFITSNKVPMLYPTGGFYDNSDAGSATLTGGGHRYWNNSTARNKCKDRTLSALYLTGHFCSGRIMDKGWEMDY